jgi:hypothetical protein
MIGCLVRNLGQRFAAASVIRFVDPTSLAQSALDMDVYRD